MVKTWRVEVLSYGVGRVTRNNLLPEAESRINSHGNKDGADGLDFEVVVLNYGVGWVHWERVASRCQILYQFVPETKTLAGLDNSCTKLYVESRGKADFW